MWISCAIVAVLGFVFNMVLAYVATDIDAIFASPLGQPLGAILVLSMGNGGFTKLLWICTVISKFGVVFVINTAGTRIYFAYARDGALPMAKWLSTVNSVTKTPINATIALSTVFALLRPDLSGFFDRVACFLFWVVGGRSRHLSDAGVDEVRKSIMG